MEIIKFNIDNIVLSDRCINKPMINQMDNLKKAILYYYDNLVKDKKWYISTLSNDHVLFVDEDRNESYFLISLFKLVDNNIFILNDFDEYPYFLKMKDRYLKILKLTK